MRKFGVIDIVLIVLIVAGLAANAFVYGFIGKDDSDGKAEASGRPAEVSENVRPSETSPPPAPAPAPAARPPAAETPRPEAPAAGNESTPAPPAPQEPVVNTLVFTLNSPNVIVNGQEAAIDETGSAPYIQDGTSMLPLRATYELLGGTIEYDPGTRYISALFLDTVLRVKMGETGAEINGAFTALNIAPATRGDTGYVSTKTIADALGAEMTWDGDTRSITLAIPSASVIDVS